jgi:hypothetical protein
VALGGMTSFETFPLFGPIGFGFTSRINHFLDEQLNARMIQQGNLMLA